MTNQLDNTFVIRTDDIEFEQALIQFLSNHREEKNVNATCFGLNETGAEKVMAIVKENGETKMAGENVIEIKNIKAHLKFSIFSFERDSVDVSLEVESAADIEDLMKRFINEQWEELFGESHEPKDFTFVIFNGISFVNNDEINRINMQVNRGNISGSCLLDIKSFADKNADKLKRIKDIISE